MPSQVVWWIPPPRPRSPTGGMAANPPSVRTARTLRRKTVVEMGAVTLDASRRASSFVTAGGEMFLPRASWREKRFDRCEKTLGVVQKNGELATICPRKRKKGKRVTTRPRKRKKGKRVATCPRKRKKGKRVTTCPRKRTAGQRRARIGETITLTWPESRTRVPGFRTVHGVHMVGQDAPGEVTKVTIGQGHKTWPLRMYQPVVISSSLMSSPGTGQPTTAWCIMREAMTFKLQVM